MDRFPMLETASFLAFIAENSAVGIHRAGYNGVASLIPRHTGNNIFVPTFAGMNYETISLEGLPPYRNSHPTKFEPRAEPMHIESADGEKVVLVQPETGHARVSARITFAVREPHYLHQRIELTFHHRFCSEDRAGRFDSLWASYLHMPPDRHIYLKPDQDAGGDLANWLGITKADHGAPDMQVRCLPDGHEIDAESHLKAMGDQAPLSDDDIAALPEVEWSPAALPKALDGPLAFYYGLLPNSLLYLMMFKQPERIRLAYSPCGGGRQPAWNPAWDYVLHLDDAEAGSTHVWDVCLVVKPWQGRADVLNEVRLYRTS